MTRRAGRIDANQGVIVAALRAAGASVAIACVMWATYFLIVLL